MADYLIIGGAASGRYHSTDDPTRWIVAKSPAAGGLFIRQKYEFRMIDWRGHNAPVYVLAGMSDAKALELLQAMLDG